MTQEELNSLSPFYQNWVIGRCRQRGIPLSQFDKAEIPRIREGTRKLAALIGKDENAIRIVPEEDEAENERKALMRVFESGCPERYRKASLADFGDSCFIRKLASGQSGLVTGDNGLGKTHLAWALAWKWKRDNPKTHVQVVKGAVLLSEVKASEGDWYRNIRESYGKSEHLIIDEVDKIKGSEADWMLLTYLIDHRYEWERQTVVMGNCGRDDTIRLLGQSSYSRLTGDGAEAYHLTGKDRRHE